MNDIRLIIHDSIPSVKIKVNGDSGVPKPIYDGETTIIPSASEEQILQTKNHIIKDNIIIGKIPKNYGKVSYNGSFLRIE